MSEKKRFVNSGGLWLRDKIDLRNPQPRWYGSFACECGIDHKLVGYGRDQQKSQNPKAPTIQIRRAPDD